MHTLLSNVLLLSASIPLLGYGATRRTEGSVWGPGIFSFWRLLRYGAALLKAIPVTVLLAGLYLAKWFTRQRTWGHWVRGVC